ncbi:hypothetical protein Tco_0873877, partial [Tanacetum coccineum]
TLGLWYSRDSPFELVVYTNSDYAGATQDRKSTTGGYLLTKGFDAGRFQYLDKHIDVECFTSEVLFEGRLLMSICSQAWLEAHVGDEVIHKELGDRMKRVPLTVFSFKEAEQGTVVPSIGPIYGQTHNEPNPSGNGSVNTLGSGEDSLKLIELMDNVGDEAVHKELGDRMERAATTASSLEAEQDSVNTLESGEDSLKLIELMAHYTTLSVLNLNSLSIHQMASLEFCDKHNMVAYLEKSEGSEGFHQIIDFLTASHIKNALTECPTLYASPIEQFWQTTALSTNEDGVRGITATIDRKVKERSLIEELDLDAEISLVPPNAADQGRINDTQFSDQPEEQLGVFSVATALADAARRRQSVENVQTYTRRRREVSTGSESSKPVEEEIVQQDGVIAEQAVKESSRIARGRRKKSLAKKRVKETLSEEKEESLNIESLATKYPIVDWEIQILANDQYYYQIKRADGSVKHYKIFSAMLYDFDRQDVLELCRLVKDRFQTASPKGYNLLLWGDLKTMMEPNEEDEIWRNQQDWNMINWKLHNFCGVHVLLMDTGFVIHMMVEKKYHLSQDTFSKMLSRRLEVDHIKEMGYDATSRFSVIIIA